MAEVSELKRLAGIRACDFVESGMLVGLGTGSTVRYTILELGKRMKNDGLKIKGVPTSLATESLALELGIPLMELPPDKKLDIIIDGADEFDLGFNLIKGGGGALLREKIVAQRALRMIVVADQSKQVNTLGNFPLPIEVTPFAHECTMNEIKEILDCEVIIRKVDDDIFNTDNDNFILDAHVGPKIENPKEIESKLLQIPGVVQVGLFVNMCDDVVLATKDGIEVLSK